MRSLLLLFICFNLLLARGQELSEKLDWYFLYGSSDDTVNIGTKGSVQYSLWKSGKLPDPFIDSNDLDYRFLEDDVISIKSNFNGDEYLNYEHVELILESVDTYADVLVNGDPIFFTQNAFATYRVDISGSLISGVNEIELRIIPPVVYHEDEYKSESYHLPAPNDAHPISIASRVRKAQFQFGWDWVPRMNTLGVNGRVELQAYNQFTIEKPEVYTYLIDDSIGVIRYTSKVLGDYPEKIRTKTFSGEKMVRVENGVVVWYDTVSNPNKWFPKGLGAQMTYSDVVKFYNDHNEEFKAFEVKYGFRDVQLIREADQWGESYYFKVNGKRIFAKGANYIPASVFIHEITPQMERELVAEMAKSNFNMIRVWGGGTYASNDFLNACDSLGILVWHDLMFACAMYPGDERFLNNVSFELDQQLGRILNHPCVAQINGNNEVDVAWKNWGLQESYKLDEAAQAEIYKSYVALFQDLVPRRMRDYQGVPYTHTSPLSNWGKLTDFNVGSQHYWGLWHGDDELVDAKQKIGRFNSEYGFQSFPDLYLLQAYSSNELKGLADPGLKYRQRSYVGNGKILEKIAPMYGGVNGLEDFVYKSQLFQAYALETYIREHRRNPLRCGGTLYWQFNDVYPGPTWSTIDFRGGYKAAHYAVKRNFEDLLIYWSEDSLYFSNLTGGSAQFTIDFEWSDLKGKLKEQGLLKIEASGLSTTVVGLQPFKKRNAKKELVLRLTCSGEIPTQRKLLYFRKQSDEFLGANVTIRGIELLNDHEGLLVLESDGINEKTWIQSSLDAVRFDDNFIDLLPGQHEVPFSFIKPPSIEDFRIYGN